MTQTTTQVGEQPAETRFAFGENWTAFLNMLNEDRIREAESSLGAMLGVAGLSGKRFLDVGSGSGLSSLVAMRLDAERVHSFDYDMDSVRCTAELRARYFPGSERWTVERGDILDADYVRGLGLWDIVYSWGVLHHTGEMWRALDHAAALVAPGGVLFLSLYNDQGQWSRVWWHAKRLYHRGPLQRWFVKAATYTFFAGRRGLADILWRRNPLTYYREYSKKRGMSMTRDWIDWIGGYPFEVAKPEAVLDFCRQRGFTLERLQTVNGLGCNQYVFRRES